MTVWIVPMAAYPAFGDHDINFTATAYGVPLLVVGALIIVGCVTAIVVGICRAVRRKTGA